MVDGVDVSVPGWPKPSMKKSTGFPYKWTTVIIADKNEHTFGI